MNIEAGKADFSKKLDELRDDICKLSKRLDVVSVALDEVKNA